MLNKKLLEELVHFDLKRGEITSDDWENIICDTMGAKWIKGKRYLADGILDNNVLNIKTLGFKPSIKKKVESRDFLSHPVKEFDPTSQMIIQRRTNLPPELDESSDPCEIGKATLRGFEEFAQESHDKFGTTNVLDVIVRHGVDRTQKNYLAEININDHQYYNAEELEWCEKIAGAKSKQRDKRVAIEGWKNGKKLVSRISANGGRTQTNYLKYLDLTTFKQRLSVSVPIPKTLPFVPEQERQEIDQARRLQINTY